MINLILMIVASLMAFILMPISLVYGLIRSIFHKGLSYYFWQCALSIDQTGNTVGDDAVFSDILGNLILLTIPSALMTCNSGNPDGDIIYLQANNTVSITTV
jgi:hypothetical protein